MRNAEVIRQWSILRDLESSRRVTIDDLAERTGVSTRTIRRDLEALQAAGFPLFDEVHEGKRYWTLEQRAFRRLDDTGFTLAELTAIYFSRSLVECLAATPFQRDVRSAFDKLATALTPGMRQFLDRLPLVIQAKAEPGSQSLGDDPSTPVTASLGRRREARVAQLLDATIHHRRTIMRYHSFSSERVKNIHRAVSAGLRAGGFYVVIRPEPARFAPSPSSGSSASLTEESIRWICQRTRSSSLGVNQEHRSGSRLCSNRGSRHLKERVWHPSQQTGRGGRPAEDDAECLQ